MAALDFLVWGPIALVGWHHVGFPVALRALARRAGPPATPPPLPDDRLPTVTLVVPAHNEAAVIAAKIADCDSLDYPQGRLTVVLGLDGCSDATRPLAEAAVAAARHPERFEIVEFVPNRGKLGVLNELIGRAAGSVVALSDTSALLGPDALRRAVAHLADPAVGVVCASYRIPDAGSEGERLYWRQQVRLKADEAAVAGAPMGAHGSFYLFRRELWQPLPPDTINDDFVLPMEIVAGGRRAVYDATLAATELERTAEGQDVRRRLRIGAGNMQQVLRLIRLVDPRRPALAFVFISGKMLRALVPFLLVLAGCASAAQAIGGSGTASLLLLAGLLAVIAGAVVAARPAVRWPRPLAWLGYFVAGHAASGLGAVLYLVGRHGRVWRWSSAAKTTRQITSTL